MWPECLIECGDYPNCQCAWDGREVEDEDNDQFEFDWDADDE